MKEYLNYHLTTDGILPSISAGWRTWLLQDPIWLNDLTIRQDMVLHARGFGTGVELEWSADTWWLANGSWSRKHMDLRTM